MSSNPSSSISAVREPVANMRLNRRLILLFSGLAVAGSVYLVTQATAAENETPPAAPPPPTVTVAPVEQRLIIDQRELLGRVEATESVELRPRVSGHIDEVRLQAGQLVKEGDVLFVIDPRWYRAQFDLAHAAVERAKVRAAIAEREARRAESLLAERAISVEEADTRTSRLAEARAELLAAEAALDAARLDLDHTEVRAPISGRVSHAYVTAGNLVSGSPAGATLLTTIVSVGEVYVYADIDESTLLTFNQLEREGRLPREHGRIPVEMRVGDEEVFAHRGYVESSDNHLNAGTGSLAVRMVFPNPDGALIPGLFARVRIPVSASEPALLVSERAIGTDQSQKYVLTVGPDNTVEYRTVTLGPVIGRERIIRDGLNPGDRVIINGLQRVRPGMAVNAEPAPIATTLALK